MAAEQTPGIALNQIRGYEARFGDKDGALALLQYPLQKREFFLQLADKVDLPDSPPAGSTWEPFFRGWEHQEYYIVALTEPDAKALRPGMIYTQMIAFPLGDAERFGDMAAIFEVLQNKERAYAPEISIIGSPEERRVPASASLMRCVAHNLIHHTETTAVISQDGFQTLVSGLWKRFQPELRRMFSFGFSFTPADLRLSRTNLVAVPSSCGSRWTVYNFKCDLNWNQPMSEAVLALIGDSKADDFLAFVREMGLEFESFRDYGKFSRFWSYWQRRTSNDPEITLALLRSFGALIPSPNHAKEQKEEAMRIAASMLVASTQRDILALRSVKVESFPFDAAMLGNAVRAWLKTRVQDPRENAATEVSTIVLAISTSQSVQWQTWIRSGLRDEFATLNKQSARIVWSIWYVHGTFAEIVELLPYNARCENELVQTCPANLPLDIFNLLRAWCAKLGWFRLLAKGALTCLGFDNALDLILEQGKNSARTDAIELLCTSVTASQVWHGALRHNDSSLVPPAIVAASSEPTLWSHSASNDRRWLELLESAAATKPHFLSGTDTQAIKLKLYAVWENGAPINITICEALAKAGQLTFKDCPNRVGLWTKFPRQYLEPALLNTLRSWLNDYFSRPPVVPVLERELAERLFAPQNRGLVFPSSSPFMALGGLMLVEAYGGERDCDSWLNAVYSARIELSLEIAEKAGVLIADRHWMAVARAAKNLDERQGKRHFGPLWQKYYESLGRLEKFAFDYLSGLGLQTFGDMKTAPSNSTITAVIVTALPEEFSAVRAHLSNRRELVEDGTIYEIGLFGVDQATFSVAVVQTGMGNSQSAAATARALSRFKPVFAFFVGIAGGLREDLRIGDVVAASKVYGYESGKSGTSFQPRPEAPPVTHEAEQRANAVVRDATWQKRISPRPKTIPTAVVRPIAAGEKILVSESSEDLKRVRKTYTDAHAVAMEDHGFATAVRGHPSVCFAVVRGISDLIENKQEADRSGSHEIAARNAAAFAFEMLTGLLRARESKSLSEH